MVVKMSHLANSRRTVSADITCMTKLEFGYKQKIEESSTEEIWKYLIWSNNSVGMFKHSKLDRILMVLTGSVLIQLDKGAPTILKQGNTTCLKSNVAYSIAASGSDCDILIIQPAGYEAKLKVLKKPIVITEVRDAPVVVGVQAHRERKVLTMSEREERAEKIKRIERMSLVMNQDSTKVKDERINPMSEITRKEIAEIRDFNRAQDSQQVTLDLKASTEDVSVEKPVLASKANKLAKERRAVLRDQDAEKKAVEEAEVVEELAKSKEVEVDVATEGSDVPVPVPASTFEFAEEESTEEAPMPEHSSSVPVVAAPISTAEQVQPQKPAVDVLSEDF